MAEARWAAVGGYAYRHIGSFLANQFLGLYFKHVVGHFKNSVKCGQGALLPLPLWLVFFLKTALGVCVFFSSKHVPTHEAEERRAAAEAEAIAATGAATAARGELWRRGPAMRHGKRKDTAGSFKLAEVKRNGTNRVSARIW